MSEKVTSTIPSNLKNQPTMMAIVGLILVVLGAMIITIPGFPFRGSGLGTIMIVLGAIVIIIAFLRFNQKPK